MQRRAVRRTSARLPQRRPQALPRAGPRGFLDFPDDVAFPATPVYATASQTFLVANAGTAPAALELQARPPFAAQPAAGELAPGEMLRCSVAYSPAAAGARARSPAACSAAAHGRRCTLSRAERPLLPATPARLRVCCCS